MGSADPERRVAEPARPALPEGAEPTTRAGRVRARLGIALGVFYLLVPTGGWIELVPDALPFVGSLDEAGATGLVILGAQYLRRARREREHRH